MATDLKFIYCSVCGKKFNKFWKTKDGKTRSGYSNLADHFIRKHPAEYDKVDEFAKGDDSWKKEVDRNTRG